MMGDNLKQLRRDAEDATVAATRAIQACVIAEDKARDAQWHRDQTWIDEERAWDRYCKAKNREYANTRETP